MGWLSQLHTLIYLSTALAIILSSIGCNSEANLGSRAMGLELTLVFRDDVGVTALDRMVDHGEVLAIRLSDLEALWVGANYPPEGPSVLGVASFEIKEFSLPEDTIILPINSQGKINIELVTEEMMLCLANIGPLDLIGSPYQVAGCIVVNPLTPGRIIVIDRGGLHIES